MLPGRIIIMNNCLKRSVALLMAVLAVAVMTAMPVGAAGTSDYDEYRSYLRGLGFPDSYVDRLYELYVNYENVEDFSQVVTLDEIAAKGYDLSPNKYVQYHREAIKPYAEVLAEFKSAYEEVKLREAEFRNIINA